MSSDLYERELNERFESLEPTQTIQPGLWTGFARGTGSYAMRALARTGSAIDLLGALGPMAQDYISGGTEARDRYFREHDEVFGRAIDYWTPREGEVGIAGMMAGELLTMIPMVIASPSLAVGGLMVGEAEELMRRGVPAGKALEVGGIQATGLGLGIYVPILGRTLTSRLLLGGAGFNVVQGVATRGLSAEALRGSPEAEIYKAFDPTYLTLDVLMGLAFGGLAHVSPDMRAHGAVTLERLERWLQNAPAGTVEALAAMRQAQHMAADSLPGKPAEPKDAAFHVERVRRAMEQAVRNDPINVSDTPEPRVDPHDPELVASREEHIRTLTEAAEQVRLDEGLARPPEPEVAPARLAPEDLTLVPPEGQARALAQAVENRLLEMKMSEQEARANAAIWEAFFETTSRKYGVRVSNLVEDYGIDVRRMSRADIERLQPGVLEQAARTDIERVAQRINPGSDDFVSVAQANKLARTGDPDAGLAAMIAYVTDDFTALTSDRRLSRPATKALMEWVQKTPPDQTGPLYRVLAFQSESKRTEFLQKMMRGRTAAIEAERPVMSFTTEDPASGTMMTHIGRDVASQFGDYPLVLEVKGRAGGPLNIGRDVSRAYGKRTPFGTDVLVPKGQQFEVGTITHRAGEPWVTLHPTRGAESPILFQAQRAQQMFYSELGRQIEAANIKAAPAKAWKDYLRSLVGKGVKADEIKWSGIEEWLDLQDGRIKKEQVQEFLDKRGVRVEETLYGRGPRGQPSLDDPEIQAQRRELSSLGFGPDVNPENPLILGFLDDAHDDIIGAAEIRQYARDAKATYDEARLSTDPNIRQSDLDEMELDYKKLERAADLAMQIERYWEEGPGALPGQDPMGPQLSTEGLFPMGRGTVVPRGQVHHGTDGDFTGPGRVYKFMGAEYYIFDHPDGRFEVPHDTEHPGRQYQSLAQAERALWWDVIVPGEQLGPTERWQFWQQQLHNRGWFTQFQPDGMYIRHPDGGELINVTAGEAEANPRVPNDIEEIAERAEYERTFGQDAPAGWRGVEGGRPTKFGEYQLRGESEDYFELTLRLPEKRALPPGWNIREQRPEVAPSERLEQLANEYQAKIREMGLPDMSADELELQIRNRRIEMAGARRDEALRYLSDFSKRWDDVASEATNVPRFVLVRPDGSGDILGPHLRTMAEAEEAARGVMAQMRDELVFTGGHFDEPDVIAHFRANSRVDADDGKRVLMVEEIQADWAQRARRSRMTQVEELAKDRNITKEEADKLVAKDAGFFHNEPIYRLYYDTPKGQVDIAFGKNEADARSQMDPGWLKILQPEAIKLEKQPGPRRGAVPHGPFVGKTEAWAGLTLKRIIRWAAENGFDKIAWTTGEQQVERYTHALRKKVDSIDWVKTEKGVHLIGYKNSAGHVSREMGSQWERTRTEIANIDRDINDLIGDRDLAALTPGEQGEVTALRETREALTRDLQRQKQRTKVVDTTQREDELSDAIGKAMADRIRNDPAQSGTIEGENIRIDDTGMAGFYERILPSVAKDVMKQLKGGKLAKVRLELGPDKDTAARYEPTSRELPEFDEMADSARETYSGAENFRDGEPPLLGETKIKIDGEPIDVEVLIAPDGVHFIGQRDGNAFELLMPKDRFRRPSQWYEQNAALNAVDDIWRNQDFWANNVELIVGDVRGKGEGTVSEQPGIEITPELREKALTSMPLFQAPERAAIRIGPETVLALFEKSDASSFVHESGHLFLEMTRDLVSRGGAPLEALSDWSTLARWLKIEGGEITREQHEKFATSFERYLAEGKAPSPELRSVFQQFRDWLISIYRSLANIAEELPDEIRGVMDRMLASQRRDPTPRAEGPPRAEAEPPPPPGEAETAGRPEAQKLGPDANWREIMAAQQADQPARPARPRLPLTDPAIAAKVDLMLEVELGWEQIGGRRARQDISTTSGQPNFTEWIPKSEVWPGRPAKHMNEDAVRRAVAKARAGERLGKAERATVDYLVDIANQRMEDVELIGGPEEWNATARDTAAAGLEPTTQNVTDADLVARAAEVDELAVERAALKYENDEAAFMAEIRRIGGKRQAEGEKPGEGAPEGGPEGDGEAPGAGEPGAEPNPLRDAAIRYVNENPEQLIPTGTDAEGNTTYQSLRDYVDGELLAVRDAREDIDLIEAAATCLRGRA